MLCQALGDAHRLLQTSPQPLTWPDTSPLLHIARSTDGLSARTWMPARSWGPGLSQGGLERVGEEEHSTKRVRLVTAGPRTSSTKLLAILPGQWVLGGVGATETS